MRMGDESIVWFEIVDVIFCVFILSLKTLHWIADDWYLKLLFIWTSDLEYTGVQRRKTFFSNFTSLRGWGWNDLRIFQWNFQSWHELRRQRVLQVIKQTSESLMLTSDTTACKFDCANFSLYHSAREKPLLNERKNDWLFSSFEWKSSSHLYPFYI